MIEWYAPEIDVLESSPLVTLYLHATRSSSSPRNLISYASRHSLGDAEKSSPQYILNTPDTPTSASDPDNYDIEKHPEIPESRRHSTVVAAGRPLITQFITRMVEKADINDRLVVASCGPNTLMQTTRETVADCITTDGPSLELHCQQFGF